MNLFTRHEKLTAEDLRHAQGRRVLFLMSSHGHVVQETVKPMQRFEAAGCAVTFACLDQNRISFDPLTNIMAAVETLWDPTLSQFLAARRKRRFRDVPSIREMEQAGTLQPWLDQFDAIVVPGGHGRTFWNFLCDPLTQTVVRRFLGKGRVVGLVCHAGLIGAQPDVEGTNLAKGRVMACWPRAADRIFGAVPILGRYMVPYPQPAAVVLERAGARIHDSMLTFPRIHAVIDGTLVTSRGPWSDEAFAAAVLRLFATRPTKEAQEA